MMAHWCSICSEPCFCCTEECEHDCPETTIEKKRATISKSRAEPSQSVAPEPPFCPVCKVTPMMRDAGGDWECPNRTVGGPHSRFATGEVRGAPPPDDGKAITRHNSDEGQGKCVQSD